VKIHPRTLIVQSARHEFSSFLLDLIDKHELTFGETIQLLSNEIGENSKYLIRVERHGNSDKKGDEE